MSTDHNITKELNQIMTNSLLQLQKLVDSDLSGRHDFLLIVKTFLLGVITTAVDMIEITSTGNASFIYADIEAAAKLGGLRSIAKWSADYGSTNYSVSNIAEDDMETGMNYLGQQLMNTQALRN